MDFPAAGRTLADFDVDMAYCLSFSGARTATAYVIPMVDWRVLEMSLRLDSGVGRLEYPIGLSADRPRTSHCKTGDCCTRR